MEIDKLKEFMEYVNKLDGYEKGEAQVFLDRLFQAFGHGGYKEAGATIEYKVKKKNQKTSFADLYWEPRLLFEMKKRGEKLQRHYNQVREYWFDIYPKPRYVVLCNFDEFWIYDFFNQSEAVDKFFLKDLPRRYPALNFLFPESKKPVFRNDMVAVSIVAADKIAQIFNSLIERGIKREKAQRFILQCVFCLFAEDFDLLPRTIFTEMINDCVNNNASSYDHFGTLFSQMDNPNQATGGRFQKVAYFNGGLFSTIDPIDLTNEELLILSNAANEDWSKVQPPIFGALFEGSMDQNKRHASGAHFTNEVDIKKIVGPTIENYWKDKIDKAKTFKELKEIREQMLDAKFLDPACGCGNFLYIAYREMKRIEMSLISKVYDKFSKRSRDIIGSRSLLSLHQFYGIDNNPFAVELTKVTLMLAKEQSIVETRQMLKDEVEVQYQKDLGFDFDPALPLDNIDNNIICDDALFCKWPTADFIIGNPPFQSKNKMQQELGPDYLNKVRDAYPGVPGMADYCVYWFRKTHDELRQNKRAGLVGTNTIRQNYSRIGGLDYITSNGGTIIEAVSSQPWSGDAVVHVSIVNWIKGDNKDEKILIEERGYKGNIELKKYKMNNINSALSSEIDVTSAKKIIANNNPKKCFQGQTHGHDGFLLKPEEAKNIMQDSELNKNVIFPYLIADKLIGSYPPIPDRYVIDFGTMDIIEASNYVLPFSRVKSLVLPTRKDSAVKEEIRNQIVLKKNPNARVNHHHKNFLNRWWQLSYQRKELMDELSTISKYIACPQVMKRHIFEFISTEIHPNAALMVFPFEDDYSFGILQSIFHWIWFKAQCSTLKDDYRYTSTSVFESFPWPQSPEINDIENVSYSARKLRKFRQKIMIKNNWSFRQLYRILDFPGENPLRICHVELDNAVWKAYRMRKNEDPLKFLLELNLDLSNKEKNGEEIIGPGLPSYVEERDSFIDDFCI